MKTLFTSFVLLILLFSCSKNSVEPKSTHFELLTSGLWMYEETQNEPLLLYFTFNTNGTGTMTRISTDDYGEFTNKTSHEISWMLYYPTLTINDLLLTITELNNKVMVLNDEYVFNRVDEYLY